MIIRAVFLLLLLVAPSGARCGTLPGGFDTTLAAAVFGTAVAFITPRALAPVTPPQLTLWGLHGLSSIDPQLVADEQGDELRLSAGTRLLFQRPAPPGNDATAWGQAAADMAASAWTTSPALRQAGTQGVIQGFFNEMFNHFDPYSRYIAPRGAVLERDRLAGQGGAGISLVGNGRVVISDIVPDGPAQDAGLRVGDRILSVDGVPVRGQTADEVMNQLNGPRDTHVVLRVRGRDGSVRTADIVRALVPPETVFANGDGALLVIRITAFSSNTAQRLSQALEAGLHGPVAPHGVVIDLRGDRGGLLRQAVTAVALVQNEGLVVTTAGRHPQSVHEWRVEGGDLTNGLPLVVLVDGHSASAAEIMAAALADRGRAVVVGSVTLGKGLVQTITQLPDGGELFVTWSRVLAPLGWPLQGLGVMPQVCTSLGHAETKRQLHDLLHGIVDMAAPLQASREARAPLDPERVLALRDACPAAEGGDDDVEAARFLVEHPPAYQAALIGGPALSGSP